VRYTNASGKDLTMRIPWPPGLVGIRSFSDSFIHAYGGPSARFLGYGNVVLRLPPRISAMASRLRIRPELSARGGTGMGGGSLKAANERGVVRAARAIGGSCAIVGAELRI
jgi:hypothetical protein